MGTAAPTRRTAGGGEVMGEEPDGLAIEPAAPATNPQRRPVLPFEDGRRVPSASGGLSKTTHFPAPRYTFPSFITKDTCPRALTSASGSPCTAMTSAYAP